MDLFARKIGMDPVEVRRKNFIPKDKFPYTVATGLTYDSGNYEPALDKALSMLDYQAFRQAAGGGAQAGPLPGRRRRHLHRDLRPRARPRWRAPSGFGGGLYDSAIVRVYPTGVVRVYIGASPHGQGEETTFAQIVAEEFGYPVENVEIVHGDTETTPQGWGTYGSRTTAVCGSAVKVAAQRVKEKAKKIAAHLLEANEQDIEWKDDAFRVRGSPDQAKTFAEVALMANVAWNMPAGRRAGTRGDGLLRPHQLRLSRSAPTSAPSKWTSRPAR